MELAAAGDAVHLAAYRPRAPASVANGRSGYRQWHGDETSVGSPTSGAPTGYETLDSPPHYDFYANTEVRGRQRRFRPSLYQLYATPQVGTCFCFFCWLHRHQQKPCEDVKILMFAVVSRARMTPGLPCTRRPQMDRWTERETAPRTKRKTGLHLNLPDLVGYKVSW